MERLIQIYEMQKELDEETFKRFNLTDKDVLKTKRILGLLVEIAELANATKSFKYWSRALPGTRDEILDEYADGLHFVLSMCLDLEVSMDEKFPKTESIEDLSELFLLIFKYVIDLKENFTKTNIKELLAYYIYLGERLGFKMGDIIEGYIKTNKLIKEKNEYNY